MPTATFQQFHHHSNGLILTVPYQQHHACLKYPDSNSSTCGRMTTTRFIFKINCLSHSGATDTPHTDKPQLKKRFLEYGKNMAEKVSFNYLYFVSIPVHDGTYSIQDNRSCISCGLWALSVWVVFYHIFLIILQYSRIVYTRHAKFWTSIIFRRYLITNFNTLNSILMVVVWTPRWK